LRREVLGPVDFAALARLAAIFFSELATMTTVWMGGNELECDVVDSIGQEILIRFAATEGRDWWDLERREAGETVHCDLAQSDDFTKFPITIEILPTCTVSWESIASYHRTVFLYGPCMAPRV
jgi:hypothetical protein